MAINFSFRTDFDSESFEAFARYYCNIILGHQDFYLTKQGKDDKIDVYSEESFNVVKESIT